MRGVILDAGPLAAFYCKTEERHLWVVKKFQQLELPVLTCEPVVTEAACLVENKGVSSAALRQAVQNGFHSRPIDAENGPFPSILSREDILF